TGAAGTTTDTTHHTGKSGTSTRRP
ncbi:MAG: hypothetical protein JWN79_2822, partial [Gemmatimonadetes bacterium]|nr:hypothetical protein [Gemmatimonadota bacterium]